MKSTRLARIGHNPARVAADITTGGLLEFGENIASPL